MEEQNIYELADRYLAGVLQEKERNEVDEKLESDPAFAKIFARYLIARQQTKELGEAEWKKELMANFAEEAEAPSEGKGKIRRLNILRFAAAAAVLCLLVAYFLLGNPSNPEQLYADASQDIFQERVYKQTSRSDDSDFISLFKKKDYPAALVAAEQATTQASEVDQSIWLERQGFCHWQLGNWAKANIVFEQLAQSEVLLPEKNPARWYQALTYLGMDDQENCKTLLRQIAAMPKSDYKTEAAKLLGELE